MPQTVIATRGLSKRFADVLAVDRVDLAALAGVPGTWVWVWWWWADHTN
jgi:hypothetical protein